MTRKHCPRCGKFMTWQSWGWQCADTWCDGQEMKPNDNPLPMGWKSGPSPARCLWYLDQHGWPTRSEALWNS